MVSFPPDWSRFAGSTQPQRGDAPSSQYERHREEESLRLAEQYGYFLLPTAALLAERFTEVPRRKRSFLDVESAVDLSLVWFVRLERCRVRLLGDIGLCPNLTVCLLGNNYLAKFDGLAACSQLAKLDLHGNQITWLPDPFFWSGLPRLRILHLHDNPIGDIENIHYMASCPALEVLTLYDTPLSLKRNYRHHAVNTVWTLKALDNFIVSDEEIIEDADFGGRFSVFNASLAVQTFTPLGHDATLWDELRAAREVLRQINNVMAHHSPVVIIQKMARGYLSRKRLDASKFAKFWPQTRAQQKYDEWRRCDSHASTVPPPSSPVSLPSVSRTSAPTQQTRLDYDTYMKQLRRPGSTGVTEPSVSGSSRYSPDVLAARLHLRPPTSEDAVNQGSGDQQELPPGTPGSVKRFYIDLDKLQKGTLQSLHEEALLFDSTATDASSSSVAPTDSRSVASKSGSIHSTHKREREKQHASAPPAGRGKPRPTRRAAGTCDEEEGNVRAATEVPPVEFRLSGLKSTISVYDPVLDMIISRREAGRDVRATEDEQHRRRMLAPSLPATSGRATSTDAAKRRLCRRLRGSGMGMLSLRAVQQAYDTRAKAEHRAARAGRVQSMREQRESARHQRDLYISDRRDKVRRQREQERLRFAEQHERSEMQHLQDLQQSVERRGVASQLGAEMREARTFVNDFAVQNTSVSTALARHDRLAKRDDVMADRLDTVLTRKEMEQEQQEVVRRYLEHRQLMRQTETAMSRAVLDTRILQEASERVLEARSRVEHVKARSAHAEAYAPALPSITSVDVAAGHAGSPRRRQGTLRKWAGDSHAGVKGGVSARLAVGT